MNDHPDYPSISTDIDHISLPSPSVNVDWIRRAAAWSMWMGTGYALLYLYIIIFIPNDDFYFDMLFGMYVQFAPLNLLLLPSLLTIGSISSLFVWSAVVAFLGLNALRLGNRLDEPTRESLKRFRGLLQIFGFLFALHTIFTLIIVLRLATRASDTSIHGEEFDEEVRASALLMIVMIVLLYALLAIPYYFLFEGLIKGRGVAREELTQREEIEVIEEVEEEDRHEVLAEEMAEVRRDETVSVDPVSDEMMEDVVPSGGINWMYHAWSWARFWGLANGMVQLLGMVYIILNGDTSLELFLVTSLSVFLSIATFLLGRRLINPTADLRRTFVLLIASTTPSVLFYLYYVIQYYLTHSIAEAELYHLLILVPLGTLLTVLMGWRMAGRS